MDHKTVEKLEGKIEEAIAEIIVKMGLKKLPLLPARHIMHLMAKAAVTVYQAGREQQMRHPQASSLIAGTLEWNVAVKLKRS